MKWYLAALKKYAVVDGRAHRTELWVFTLLNALAVALLWLLCAVTLRLAGPSPEQGLLLLLLPLTALAYMAAAAIPMLAAQVRRLHDTNRSGWWALLWLAPGPGWILLLVWNLLPGTTGTNRFGPMPRMWDA